MSDNTNTRAELVIYADVEPHAESTCKQDLLVQLQAVETLSADGGEDVA